MLVDDPLGNRQAKTDALGADVIRRGPLPRRIAAVEALEDVRNVLPGNSGARITHIQRGNRPDDADANAHDAARFRELDRVVEQNEHELAKQRRIAVHRRLLEVIDLEANALAIGDRSRGFGGVQRKIVEKHALSLNGPLAGVGASEHEQILNDSAKTLRLSLDRAQRRNVFLRRTRSLQRHLGPTAHGGHRRPQLVCRVSHEAAHVLDVAFDGRNRLPRQHPAPHGDQHQRHERRAAKLGDERRVSILDLDFVGDGDGDEWCSILETRALRERAKNSRVVLMARVRRAPAKRKLGRARDPRIERFTVDRSAECVDEQQRTSWNAKVMRRRLRTTNARERDHFGRRVAQRRIELTIELPRDCGEHSSAEQRENGEERSDIPRRQLDAESAQRLWQRCRAPASVGHVPRR